MIMQHVSKHRLGYAALAATLIAAVATPSSAQAGYSYKSAGRYIVTVDVKPAHYRKKRYVYKRYKKKIWRKPKTYKRWRPANNCNW